MEPPPFSTGEGTCSRGVTVNVVNLQEVNLSQIERRKRPPAFDFVEESIRSGRAYKVGENGYALIGGDSSLLAGFIVELSLPALVPSARYDELLRQLNDISCGMMWFDSSDYHSFDIVWRHGMPATACAILFMDIGREIKYRVDDTIEVRETDPVDMGRARQLFLDMPDALGGLSEARLREYMHRGRVISGYRGDRLLGSALVTQIDAETTWVSGVAVPEDLRGSGVGVKVIRSFIRLFRDSGQRVVGGVGRESLFTYRTLEMFGFEQVKQSWIVNINQRSI